MSQDDWKSKTCKDCAYRVGSECRRLPPAITLHDDDLFVFYPPVEYDNGRFNEACGEHWEEGV